MDRKHDIVLMFLTHSPRKPRNWQAVVGRRNKVRWKNLATILRLKRKT